MSYSNLGLVHSQLDDLKQAKDCNERTLDVCLKVLGSEHVYVADTYKNLGAVYNYLGLIQEAIECYDHALAIYVKNFGLEDDQVREIRSGCACSATAGKREN